VAIDTLNPTVTVSIVDTSLNDGDNSSSVTFTFSEATTDFVLGDVTVAGGTLSAFSGSGTSYTATFTANDGFEGAGTVTVPAGSYTDAVGNLGAAGSDTVAIDTLNPTVTVSIVDTSLNDGDNSSSVTFTFSEATTDFVLGDVTVAGGTLSAFSGSSTSYTATFTANDGFEGAGTVTVPAGSYTDAVGNLGAAGSDTVAIDTLNPTADIVDVSPKARTTVPNAVSIAFDEAVTGLAVAGFTLTRDGAPISLAGASVTGSGASYTLDLSTLADAVGDYTLTLGEAGAGVQDSAGNGLTSSASDSWSVHEMVVSLAKIQSDGMQVVSSIGHTTSGALVGFAFGLNTAPFELSQFGITLGIVPMFSSVGAMIDGQVIGLIPDLEAFIGQTVFVQSFEVLPTPKVSNIFEAVVNGTGGLTVVPPPPSLNISLLTPSGESLFPVRQNPIFREDVNADGTVSPVDALQVINYINDLNNQSPNPAGEELPDPAVFRFLDVSGDSEISPIDVLQVINFLNLVQNPSLNPEGEFGLIAAATPAVLRNAPMPQTMINDVALLAVSSELNHRPNGRELRVSGRGHASCYEGLCNGIQPATQFTGTAIDVRRSPTVRIADELHRALEDFAIDSDLLDSLFDDTAGE
jgi:hypothetical protein